MMRFKKIAALLVSSAMIFSMAACSDNSDTGSTTPAESASAPTEASTESAPSEAATEPSGGADIVVDVFIYDYSDTYIASVREYMADNFDKAGLDATFYDGASDQGTQTQQIETALTKGTDLLIVNIVTTGSEEAAQNIVDLAQAKDVPLIFFNREVSDAVVNSYEQCVFVGTDADEAGYMQGEMINDLIGANYDDFDLNGDGAINYIMFKGELGNAEADGRTQYSVEQANDFFISDGKTGLVYYDPANSDEFQPANWSSSEAQDAMATALGTNPFSGDNPIELVIANNDDMALGAIEALNELGYNLGFDDTGDRGLYIPVVGVDATDAAQDAIAEGKMDGTIKQDAEGMAVCIVSLSQSIANGDDLLANAGSYNMDEEVAKIRIPYAKYTG